MFRAVSHWLSHPTEYGRLPSKLIAHLRHGAPQFRHVQFDILAAYKTLYTRREEGARHYEERWANYRYYTYVQLQPGTDPASSPREDVTLRSPGAPV